MSAAETSDAARPARFGLAAKLFAILILLGAVAVLITGVLGYVRARDALEETIFNQLTAARETKARQVETYFRTIRAELRLLAALQDGGRRHARAFAAAVDELDAEPVPDELRQQASSTGTTTDYLPMVRRLLGDRTPTRRLTCRSARRRYFLQYHYIVANPHTAGPAQAGRRSRRRQRLQQAARDLPSADAHGGVDARLLRLPAGRPQVRPHHLHGRQGSRFRHLAADAGPTGTPISPPPSPAAPARPIRRRPASRISPPTCRPTAQPSAFMAAPVIDQGVVIGVLVAQLSIEEIDSVVTGDRRWRQEGFGATGEAYLVGPDYLRALRPAHVLRESRPLFRRAEGRPAPRTSDIDAIRRYGTPVLHQRVDTTASRAALARHRGHRRDPGLSRHARRSPRGGRSRFPGVKWALIAKIDSSEAFAPVYQLQRDLVIVGGVALLVVIVTGAWLSRSLLGPLRELTAGVRRFAAGDYDAKVPVRTRDEIGQLCPAFNGMVDEMQREERRDREQEPRERGAAAERPAGADRQPPARRRAGHRRRLRRGHRGLRRHRRLHRDVVGACRRPRSSPC